MLGTLPPLPDRGMTVSSSASRMQRGRGRRIGGVLLGKEASRLVDAAANHVGVNVDTAGHDDHARRVETRRVGRYRGDDAAILDADVLHLAVDAIHGVVYRTPSDPQRRHEERGRPTGVGPVRPMSTSTAPSTRRSVKES